MGFFCYIYFIKKKGVKCVTFTPWIAVVRSLSSSELGLEILDSGCVAVPWLSRATIVDVNELNLSGLDLNHHCNTLTLRQLAMELLIVIWKGFPGRSLGESFRKLRYEHILNVAFRKILLLQQLWKWNYFHRYVFVFMWLLTVTVIRLFLELNKKSYNYLL